MTNNTTIAGTPWLPETGPGWVFYYTGYGREGALKPPTNQDICNALAVALPNEMDPDGDELKEFFLEDWFGADWMNGPQPYLVHKIALIRGDKPSLEFQKYGDFYWFKKGLYAGAYENGDFSAHSALDLNLCRFPVWEDELQNAFKDFVNDLCENDELAV